MRPGSSRRSPSMGRDLAIWAASSPIDDDCRSLWLRRSTRRYLYPAGSLVESRHGAERGALEVDVEAPNRGPGGDPDAGQPDLRHLYSPRAPPAHGSLGIYAGPRRSAGSRSRLRQPRAHAPHVSAVAAASGRPSWALDGDGASSSSSTLRANKGSRSRHSADGLDWRYRGRVLSSSSPSYPHVPSRRRRLLPVPIRVDRSVRLYRAREFPLRWEPRLLLEGGTFSTPPCHLAGRWWRLADPWRCARHASPVRRESARGPGAAPSQPCGTRRSPTRDPGPSSSGRAAIRLRRTVARILPRRARFEITERSRVLSEVRGAPSHLVPVGDLEGGACTHVDAHR